MFGTFTGNSKRPRNVNLSGQAGNPFANTSWSPSVASNATKTVFEAQADRERRQADRQRVKAAGKIQKTWRGHRARRILCDDRRAAFDELYHSTPPITDVTQRLPLAFNLLSAFFSSRRPDDLDRLLRYVDDTEAVDIPQIAPSNISVSRLQQLGNILVKSLDIFVTESHVQVQTPSILKLILRIHAQVPIILSESIKQYYAVLARLCKAETRIEWSELVFRSIALPLRENSGNVLCNYQAFAFSFLTESNLSLVENNIAALAPEIQMAKLAEVILSNFSSSFTEDFSKDDLLWLLAHFVGLGRLQSASFPKFLFLQTLLMQLSALSSDISLRISIRQLPTSKIESTDESIVQPLQPYVRRHLLSLVDYDGISNLLHDFSDNLARSSTQESLGASLLAGYILTLLQCFPDQADDTRMRLFLESIPTASGPVPTVKFLWHVMAQTKVFHKLRTESERSIDVLRAYLQGASRLSDDTTEDQDWRIILLFLELYVFILRLSDDEDFFSGIYPSIVDDASYSVSRTRSCSLSLGDVTALSTFLKNTAFALHYKAQDISQTQQNLESKSKSRLESYLSTDETPVVETPTNDVSVPSTKMSIDSLRTIVTNALKMVYERDSRKRFLPVGHWLMTDKLRQEDFISAVIAEEERQNQEEEEAEDSDDDINQASQGVDSGIFSTFAGQRLSRHVRLERLKVQQSRAQRERRLAEMGPKLEILKHMPFVVPFETRVIIFRQFIQLDRGRRDNNNHFPMHHFARHQARIRRGQIFEDAFKNFYELGEGLKDTIQITFVDQFGTSEAGIDGGGVTKEFLTSVTSEAFGSKLGGLGMFTSNEQGLLYPNPTAVDTIRHTMSDDDGREFLPGLLKRFEFLGRVVGKCMYEGILVDLAFAGFFLLKWPSPGPNEENSYKGSVNDLRDMDEELYKGMLRLKNYQGDVSDLGFDFTVTDQISLPGAPVRTITRKLAPNGDEVAVTNDNRLLYISYVARHRLMVQPSLQTAAFLRGLRAIIRPTWLSMFNQSELQRLVGGDSSEIDVEDLRRNTVYSGLYEIGDDLQEHPTIQLFWKVMRGFTDTQRRDVLKYVSSTPRAPLLGFSQLLPKFSIRDAGTDEDRLPSTSTCVNLLKLPRYSRESTLREKLLYAVTSGAGFDLS